MIMTAQSDIDWLRELRDIEEIKQLKARYIEACDGGWGGRLSHDHEKMVALFTEDCVWDGGGFGQRQGRAALREYYESNQAATRAQAFHLLTQPIIQVDGDQATGRWHLTIVLSTVGGPSNLICGAFDDEYRRTAAGWRIHRSSFTTALTGEYTGAWNFL
jgi:ketosteroid isomerase-like protein